jgi:hypothetical protein
LTNIAHREHPPIAHGIHAVNVGLCESPIQKVARVMGSARSQAMWAAAAAAGLEVVTGAALVVAPSLLARLLFGSEMNASGDLVGRISGLVMLCLALACWPRAFEGEDRQALGPLLALSLLTTVFLIYVGMGGVNVGVLLWPAAAAHLILAILLARAWMSRRAAG